jgi:hypothetical protein
MGFRVAIGRRREIYRLWSDGDTVRLWPRPCPSPVCSFVDRPCLMSGFVDSESALATIRFVGICHYDLAAIRVLPVICGR